MLTKRQRMILETILNNPPGITGENLAARIGVSSRTIRNEVNEMNMDRSAGGIIHASRQKGYFIPHELEERAGTLIREEDGAEEAKDRIYRILAELLMADKLDLYQLGEDMNLAQPTVYKEAAKLKRLLQTMCRTDVIHLGAEQMWLEGTEEEIRRSVFEFLKNRMQMDFGNTVFQIRKIFQKAAGQDEYEILVCILKNYFEENEIQISDGNLLLIAIVVFFSLMRNQAGKRVTAWKTGETIRDEEVQKLTVSLKEKGFELDQGDCAVMLPLFHTMKLTPAKSRRKEISQQSSLILDEFCKEVLDKYNFDLRTLDTLLENILFHIEYMMRRLDTGYEIQNPIMNEVKKQYPFAYEIAMLIVPIIYRYKGIFLKDDEVSYIAVFIEDFLRNVNTKLKTVIISTGRLSISSIVEHWIQMNFGNHLQVMDCIPAHQLENYEKHHEVDLLITTSQNPVASSIPTYKFEGVPDTDSLDIMNAMIRKLRLGRKYKGIIEQVKLINRYAPQHHLWC